MRFINKFRPSPAMIVALVALMAGLGGSAIASSLITGKQIARNAITSKHVKDGSLTLADLSPSVRGAFSHGKPTPGSQQGSQGPAGPQGPRGAQGTSGKDGAQGPQGPQGPAGPSGGGSGSSSTPGPETLMATVTADGKLDHGKGVKAITHTAAGDYLVALDVHGLDKCTNVATIVGTQQANDGSATILVSPANVANTVRVQTFVDSTKPTATNKPFNLAVFCQ
jgi:hypothetical protein